MAASQPPLTLEYRYVHVRVNTDTPNGKHQSTHSGGKLTLKKRKKKETLLAYNEKTIWYY